VPEWESGQLLRQNRCSGARSHFDREHPPLISPVVTSQLRNKDHEGHAIHPRTLSRSATRAHLLAGFVPGDGAPAGRHERRPPVHRLL